MPRPLLALLLLASCTTPAVPKLAETLECTVYDAATSEVQRYCLETFQAGGWAVQEEADGRVVLRKEIGPPVLDRHGEINEDIPTTMDVTFDFAPLATATHVRARMDNLSLGPDGEIVRKSPAQSGRPWRQLRQFVTRLPGQLAAVSCGCESGGD